MKTEIANMKVELTAIKHAEFASEDTNCFRAIVLLDGKRAIEVSNDGHGGCDKMHDLIPGSTKRLEDYAATLPKVTTDFNGTTKPFTFQPTAETVIGDLLEEHLLLKDMRRALKRCVHFCASDGKIMVFKKTKWSPAVREIVHKSIAKYPGAVVLNELTEEEALKLWK